MNKNKLFFPAVLALALCGGCSSIKLPDLQLPDANKPPSASAVERYGPYCEQVGNFRGTPAFEACIKKQENIYK